MNRTGASASEKRIYPPNLHEVETKEQLLSLIAWVTFVENEIKMCLLYWTKLNHRVNNNRNKLGFSKTNVEHLKKKFMKV